MSLLPGKVAIVTGAARGLGDAVVRRMVAEGATVTAVDRRADELAQLAADTGCRTEVFDVTDAAEWARAVAAHPRVDVLVNNAGIIRVRPLREITPDEFRQVVDTNLTSAFLGIRAVADVMAAGGGGSIVNLSSPAAFEGAAGRASYSASKWGVRGLTKTAALELGALNIRVNTVAPGPMPTAMTRRPNWTDDDYQQFYGSTVALGRMARIDEVANLVVWLASDQASYCTGGDYTADGGVTAGRP